MAIGRYSGTPTFTIQGATRAARKGEPVAVFTAAGSLATLYDDEEGNDRKGNPFPAAADGLVVFHAEEGSYTLRMGGADTGARTPTMETWPSAPVTVTSESATSAGLMGVLMVSENDDPITTEAGEFVLVD